MNRMLILVTAATVALGFGGACSNETVPLENNHNSLHVRTFDIRSSAIVKDGTGSPLKVRASGIYDGSALTPEGQVVAATYQRSGVRAVRYPLGWGCDLSLDFVFDNELADANSVDSYNLTALDELTNLFTMYMVIPVWQAAWDIGYDGCSATPTIGVASRPISNPDKWGLVTSFLATKLNNTVRKYYDADFVAKLAGFGMMPGYVEIYPDPTDAGAFGDLSVISLTQAYNNFYDAFNEALPLEPSDGSPSRRVIGVIAPGISISDSSEINATYSSMMDFIDDLAFNPDHLPDVFSIKPEVDSLASLVDVVHTMRQVLDDNGLAKVDMAAIGATLTADTWSDLAVSQPTVEDRSMWLAAFAAAGFVRLQDDIAFIVPQRWSELPADPLEPRSGEDLFQRADGSPLPAFYVLKALREFSEDGGDRISFVNAAPVDDPTEITATGDVGDDISIMASKLIGGGYQFLVVALPPASVDRNGINMKYVLNVTDVQSGTTDWEVRIAEIDADSASFRMASRGSATVDDGNVSFSAYIKGPAVHMIRFSPPVAEEEE